MRRGAACGGKLCAGQNFLGTLAAHERRDAYFACVVDSASQQLLRCELFFIVERAGIEL